MKKLTLLIALACIIQATATSQPCLPEGITFTTQTQVDSFQINYPNCTKIEGNVTFDGEDITNLDSLNVLTSIEGNLNVGWWMWQNSSLISLEGLNNLTYVGGSLRIDRNALLVDLTGLESLTSIGGELRIGTDWAKSNDPIVGNPSLISLTGLDNLSSIGEGISIEANNSLTSLIVLNNITSIGGGLNISSNDALSNLSGLENITLIGGGVYIHNNNSLTSLAGLDNIEAESIDELHVSNNPSLSICHVQSVCDYLADSNGYVSIHDNAPGCNSKAEVDTACKYSYVGEIGILDKLLIHPNPFNQTVTIEYELQQPAKIQITIYNHLGKQVELIEQHQSQGNHQFEWHAEGLPAGVYFCAFKTESGTHTMKMIKLKK